MDTGPGPAGSEGDKTRGVSLGICAKGSPPGGLAQLLQSEARFPILVNLLVQGRKKATLLSVPRPLPSHSPSRRGRLAAPGPHPAPRRGLPEPLLAPRGPAGGGARLQPAEPRDIKGKTRLRRLLSPGARSPQRCPETPAGSAEPGAAANGASRPGAPPPPAPSAGKTQQQQPGRAPAMRRLGGVTRRRVFQGPPRLAGGSEPGAETARSPPCTHPAAGVRGPFPAAPTTAALRRLPPLA